MPKIIKRPLSIKSLANQYKNNLNRDVNAGVIQHLLRNINKIA